MLRDSMFEDSSVLVVDSSSQMLGLVTNILKKQLGFGKVISLTNGKEALKILKDNPVNWVVCEMEMAGVSGLDLLTHVRNTPDTIDTPFIMISSCTDRQSLVDAMNAGVTDFLSKPFSSEVLQSKFCRYVQNKERRVDARVTPDIQYRCDMRLRDGSVHTGSLVNISVSGCLVVMPMIKQNIKVYDAVSLALSLTEESIELEANVVRLEEASSKQYAESEYIQVGIKFQPYSNELQIELNKIIYKQ